MELNIHNIFQELEKLYLSIPENIINKHCLLFCNQKTYNIYKLAYALKYGYSLPNNLNYIGINIIVDDTIIDNFMYIIEKQIDK